MWKLSQLYIYRIWTDFHTSKTYASEEALNMHPVPNNLHLSLQLLGFYTLQHLLIKTSSRAISTFVSSFRSSQVPGCWASTGRGWWLPSPPQDLLVWHLDTWIVQTMLDNAAALQGRNCKGGHHSGSVMSLDSLAHLWRQEGCSQTRCSSVRRGRG